MVSSRSKEMQKIQRASRNRLACQSLRKDKSCLAGGQGRCSSLANHQKAPIRSYLIAHGWLSVVLHKMASTTRSDHDVNGQEEEIMSTFVRRHPRLGHREDRFDRLASILQLLIIYLASTKLEILFCTSQKENLDL